MWARIQSAVGATGAAATLPPDAAVSNADTEPREVIKVGAYTVRVARELASGAFATVFLVHPLEDEANPLALKRIVVNDPEMLRQVLREINVMKALPKHPNLINMLDATVVDQRELYTVYILMEYCPGSVVDLINKRLPSHFQEGEIMQMFAEITLGLSCLHYMKPPFIHRDIKVENVLLGKDHKFKLCDFGSATTKVIDSFSATQIALAEEEIQKFTTLAYRAPEMVDMYQKKIVNEKVDIWALGCLLYKLCYFKSPFEDGGQLAILNGRYNFPAQPQYSSDLKQLIQYCLVMDPYKRPNVYQVLMRVCDILHVACPIENIYGNGPEPVPVAALPTQRAQPLVQQTHQSRPSEVPLSPSKNDLHGATAANQPPSGMRRGRQHRRNASGTSAGNELLSSAPTSSSSSQANFANFDDADAWGGGGGGGGDGGGTPKPTPKRVAALGFEDDAVWGPSTPTAATASNSSPITTPYTSANPSNPFSNLLLVDAPDASIPSVSVATPVTGTGDEWPPSNGSLGHDLVVSAFTTRAGGSGPTTPHAPRHRPSKSISHWGEHEPDDKPMARVTPIQHRSMSIDVIHAAHSAGSSPAAASSPLYSTHTMASTLPIPQFPAAAHQRLSVSDRLSHSRTASNSSVGSSSFDKKFMPSQRQQWLRRALDSSGYSRTRVRRLVMEAWRCSSGGADDTTPFAWFFPDLSKAISPKEPASIMRALHLLQELTFEGPKTFAAELRKKHFILEDVKNTFSSAKYNDIVASRLIVKYADMLLRKHALLERHPELEGSYSLDIFFAELMKRPPKERVIGFVKVDTVRELQDLFGAMDDVREALWTSGFVTPGLDTHDLRFWIVSHLCKEEYGLVTLMLHLLGKIRDMHGPSELHNLRPRTRQIMALLKTLTEQAIQILGGTHVNRYALPAFVLSAFGDDPSSTSHAPDPPTIAYPVSSSRKYCRRLLQQRVPLSDLRLLTESTGWDMRMVPPLSPGTSSSQAASLDLTDSSEDEGSGGGASE